MLVDRDLLIIPIKALILAPKGANVTRHSQVRTIMARMGMAAVVNPP